MRLVDCFLDVLLYTRSLSRALGRENPGHDEVRDLYSRLFADAEKKALRMTYAAEAEVDELPRLDTGGGEAPVSRGSVEFSKAHVDAAKLAIVAYVDEIILCSAWTEKAQWQKHPLQREHFDTTNLGAEFFDRLNQLAKYGPERAVREVYCLCLGLGFKGKFYSNDDRQRLEEVKNFNLGLLLPEEAQRNLDTATLFPSAYGGERGFGRGEFKPRTNLMPFVIGLPVLAVAVTAFSYHRIIVDTLDRILALVITS